MHRHAALPLGRHGAAGQQRPPRAAARRRADGLRAVDALHEAPSGASALARPRSLRALGRARLGAALQPAVRDRLRPFARRHQALSPVGQQGAGAPGARPHGGRRSHDRAARPGLRQRRRHGHRRGAAGGALQPRRPPRRRPPHLGDRQRRRPDGRRRLGGRVAGRPPEARQAGLPLRQQLGDALGRHRHHVLRGPRQALRGLRLADDRRRRRQRPGGDRRRARRRLRRDDAAVADPRFAPTSASARPSRTASRRTARRSASPT